MGLQPIKRIKRFLQGSTLPGGQEYFQWITYFNEKEKRELYSSDMLHKIKDINSYEYLMGLFSKTTADSFVEKTMEVDIHSYLPYDLLVKIDIASMSNSLECRSPFLDHKLMEFVTKIPVKYKLRGVVKKYILKKAFNSMLPSEILNRPKMGFGAPLEKWFRNELRDIA